MKNNNIRITLLGDIFPGELPFTLGYGIRTQFKRHGGLSWISKISRIIGENDLIIGNLESPLLHETDARKKTFFGEREFAGFLKKCGINVVNIANNHILEHGKKGFDSTVATLRNEGIGIIGCIEDTLPVILFHEIEGKKIAFCGFSNVDLHVIKNDNCFPVLTEENVLNVLKRMKEQKADLKILCFHWGNEYTHLPSMKQRKLAYSFIDAGADIIVGHHPHVIQPYEKYRGGHIFYSLGNFMFDYIHSKAVSKGLIVHISMDQNKSLTFTLKEIDLSFKELISSSDKTMLIEQISDEYEKVSSMPEEDYNKVYDFILRKKHIRQRLLMKSSFFKESFEISFKDKKQLFRNVIHYYFNMIVRN